MSPYVGCGILSPLVGGRRFRLVTDLEACFESDAEDRLIRFLSDNAEFIRHVGHVHAKVVLTDGGALVGSANLTERGFGWRHEMGCLILDPTLLASIESWFDDLWAVGERVDETRLTSAVERGREVAAVRQRAAAGREGRTPVPHGPRRSLGWMAPHGATHRVPGREGGGGAADEREDEHEELATQLRALTRSPDECDRVLSLLARSLEVAGVSVEDQRLHLNFGSTPVSITINQRYVAWCEHRRGGEQFGFILDDVGTAEDAARRIDGAWAGRFRKQGSDDQPTLHVPVERLTDIPGAVLQSWERAILREAGRTRADGTPFESSFRRFKRPFLYRVLTDAALRREITKRAFAARCWWFGINNGSRGHVRLAQIRGLLDGRQSEFVWLVGQSKPRRLYRQMRRGDDVLLWAGHGDDPRWGIIGAAVIKDSTEQSVTLAEAHRFEDPITPYPKGAPQRTEQVEFLRSTFGDDFTPLGDVMRAVFGTRRTPPITVAEIGYHAFRAVARRTGAPSRLRQSVRSA
ncbi:MAG: phospholipase D family protein [Armatimonadetes bacterium]|nr:phospholipase D family protein [Armatimonadota bacterium]